MAIHGRPCLAVASASWSQVQGGATRAAKVDATFGEPSSVTLPLQTTGSRRKPGRPVPGAEADDRAVHGHAQRVVARRLDARRHGVEGVVRVQLGDPRGGRGRRGDLLVGEAADLGDDGRDARRGVGAGDRQVAVAGEQRVAAERRGEHRHGQRDAEELGVGLGVADAGHRRGLITQRVNASRLARSVCSVPAPLSR